MCCNRMLCLLQVMLSHDMTDSHCLQLDPSKTLQSDRPYSQMFHAVLVEV